MKKNYKALFALFAIFAIALSAANHAKADDNEGENERGQNTLPPGIVKQIQNLDFGNVFRNQEQENEHGNKNEESDRPASVAINPNGNVKLNGVNVVSAPASGANSLQVKAWGLTFNLVLNSSTELRAHGENISLTDIHANDDLNVQGTMDGATGNILAQHLEDTTATSNAQNEQLRAQINALIARLNELLNRAGLPTVPTPTPAPTSTPVAVVPTLSSLSPATTSFGGGAFTLTLNGTNFASNSVANWAGTALATTYISQAQLTAMVPAANIATTTSVAVSVTTPGTLGGTSNSINFSVH